MKTSRLLLIGLAMAVVAALVTVFAQTMLEGEGASLRSGPLQLVVASRPLPAGSRLKAEDLEMAASPGPATARTAFSSSTSVIGRTLVMTVEKGQVLREEDLAVRGSGAAIASQLPPGYRAITVALRDAGPEVVLYPGALVDVLATVEMPGRSGGRESVTRTLVEGVRVVAVNDEAVGGRTSDSGDRRTNPRRPTVTIAVTPEQAAQVELASSRGSIGVTLRSSDDPVGRSGEVAMATTQSLLGIVPDAPAPAAAPKPPAPTPVETTREIPEKPVEKPAERPVAPAAAPAPAGERPRTWEVKVLRGGKDSSSHTFNEKPASSTGSDR